MLASVEYLGGKLSVFYRLREKSKAKKRRVALNAFALKVVQSRLYQKHVSLLKYVPSVFYNVFALALRKIHNFVKGMLVPLVICQPGVGFLFYVEKVKISVSKFDYCKFFIHISSIAFYFAFVKAFL